MILNASGCLDALTAPDVARELDAFVTKTVTPRPRAGNEPVRIAETEVGMLNSIGLANPGIDSFRRDVLPRLAELELPIWASVGGFSAHDYADLCQQLDEERAPDVEAIAVPERPEHVDRLAADELHEGTRSWTDRVDEKGELLASRETEAHRAGKKPPGR